MQRILLSCAALTAMQVHIAEALRVAKLAEEVDNKYGQKAAANLTVDDFTLAQGVDDVMREGCEGRKRYNLSSKAYQLWCEYRAEKSEDGEANCMAANDVSRIGCSMPGDCVWSGDECTYVEW